MVAEGAGVFVDGELIDLAFAADDGFAEAEVGVDEEFGEIAGDGIDGEGDTGGIAGTICWTTTAMAACSWGKRCCPR